MTVGDIMNEHDREQLVDVLRNYMLADDSRELIGRAVDALLAACGSDGPLLYPAAALEQDGWIVTARNYWTGQPWRYWTEEERPPENAAPVFRLRLLEER